MRQDRDAAWRRAEFAAFDRRVVVELGLPEWVLMENAGAGAARALEACWGTDATRSSRALVLAGKGNNGADGAVLARHLACREVDVRVHYACALMEQRGVALEQREALIKLGLAAAHATSGAELERALARLTARDALVDALLGTGARGAPTGELARWIELANACAAGCKLALDLPSGLDADSGLAAGPAFRAQRTATFVAHKQGFDQPGAAAYCGEIVVIDLGVPRDFAARALR